MNLIKSVAQNIKRLRIKKQITMHDLAESTGLARATLYNLENETTDSRIVSVGKVAKALGVDIRELFK